MTEDEAKTKMCCGPPSVAASNYYRAGAECDAPMHCIASACMAWRWDGYTEVGRDPHPWNDEYRIRYEKSGAKGSGYCGLAGGTQ